MQLKGENITLQKIEETELKTFYNLATKSDSTPFWYGKLYSTKIPDFAEFLDDWKKSVLNGFCFFIIKDGKKIGQVNYNMIINKTSEIDIFIASKNNWGKGYGSDAIRTLVKYLFEKKKIEKIWTAAIKENKNAIEFYKSTGFVVSNPPDHIESDKYWGSKDLDKWIFFTYRR